MVIFPIAFAAIILIVHPIVHIFQPVCAGRGIGFDIDRPDKVVKMIRSRPGLFLPVTLCIKFTQGIVLRAHEIHIDDAMFIV